MEHAFRPVRPAPPVEPAGFSFSTYHLMIFSKPVIAAVDLSPASAQVLRQAADTASVERVPLFVVHVVFPGLLPHRPGCKPAAKVVEAARHRAELQLADLVSQLDLDLPVRQLVLVGRPPDEIKQLIEREQAGLLVISANQPGQKRLGSIASRCVRTVDCDVLLMRERPASSFRHIVACLDLSPASEPVLSRAAEAARGGARLELSHVSFPPDKELWTEDLDAERNAIESREYTEKALHRIVGEHAEELSPIDHQLHILESPVPSVALTCHITDTGADLVVLGTRGHSKLGAMFFGTNAERLLHDVPASVLAVRI